MFDRFLLAILGAGILGLGVAVEAQTKPLIPVSAAKAQCKSLDGATEEQHRIYLNCVSARSGSTRQEPEPKFSITISGSARLGIVYSSN